MEGGEAVWSTPGLLLVALTAVILLLVLIMKVKLHAFVALILVSLTTAVVAGIPLARIPDVLAEAFGSTLASVAILVAFGVMIGRLLEVSGGAQVLADTLVNRFGAKRAPLALGVAALIFGFPIFMDAGLVVFLPIILTVARRFGGSLLSYALPTAGAFGAMHAFVPPHPGPVAATSALGGDVGIVLLVNLPIAILAWYLGVMLVAPRLAARTPVAIPDLVLGPVNGNADPSAETNPKAPSFPVVLTILLLPLLLISCNTVLGTLQSTGTIAKDNAFLNIMLLLGNTPVALLITLLVAIATLGTRGRTMAETTKLLDASLGPICSVILITGAGGMFGGVLGASGIGDALTSSLAALGMPILLQAFVIAAALRVAQGSATVALTTTAGLVAAQTIALPEIKIALIVTAIAAGSTVLSHVNDAGFWLVGRLFGMDEKTTLKTWTVQETTLGLAGFAIAAVLWPLVGLL